MNESQKLFLDVLSCALRNEKIKDVQAPSQCWMEVFRLAEMHHVLPMIVNACWGGLDQSVQWVSSAKRQVRQIIMKQALQNESLFYVLNHLKKAGFHVMVVKGLCCRMVYPVPDLRFSADEDLLVKPAEFESCCKELMKIGAVCQNTDFNRDEVTFVFSELTIELHRLLFPGDSVYAHFNDLFCDVFQRSKVMTVSDHEVICMHPEDHWLYLVLHAYKHFLHGGCGIRQICDVMMYAKAYSDCIDWKKMLVICQSVHVDGLVAAWMKLGNEHLGFDESVFSSVCNLDVSDLLEDVLDSGVYGTSTLNRRHTASMTLGAFDEKRQGKSLMSSLFPSKSVLRQRYPFVDSSILLLPAAWILRWLDYAKEVLKKDSSIKETLRLGAKRKELFIKVGILSDEGEKRR